MRHVEPLESRRLLSTGAVTLGANSATANSAIAVWTAAPGGTVNFASDGTSFTPFTVGNDITKTGTLVVKGSAGDDRIEVIRDGNKIKYTKIFAVTFTGATASTSTNVTVVLDAAKVKRVYVEAAGGDDRVFVDNELAKPCTVLGGGGDDVIDGNDAATLLGGAGDDKLSVSPDGVRASYLSGGDGNDTLVADAARDTVVGGRGNDLVIGRATIVVHATGEQPNTNIESIFDVRASGIEQFFGQLQISHA